MEHKRKTGSIGGIITFFIIFSVLTNVFSNGNLAYLPFILIFIFISVVSYLARKANKEVHRDREEETKHNIFKENEESFKKESYKPSTWTKETGKDYQSVKHDYSHRCPRCKTLISSKEKKCPECGMIQQNTIKCKTCGHINPTGNVVCENCNDFLY